MNKINIKKVFFFWQEIIFIIGLIGYLYPPNGFHIVFTSVLISIILILILQLFLRNFWISLFLSVVLFFASSWMTLAVISDLRKPDVDVSPLYGLILFLFIFLGLTITSVTMPIKYGLIKSIKREE